MLKKLLSILITLILPFTGRAQELLGTVEEIYQEKYKKKDYPYFDRFNCYNPMWQTVDNDSLYFKFEKGGIAMRSNIPDSGCIYQYIYFPFDQNKDFTIKTAMKKESRGPKNPSNYLFMFGVKDTANFYSVIFNSGGAFRLGKVENMEDELLSDWITFPLPTGYNRLKIKKKDNKLHFYINSKKRYTMDCPNFFGRGFGYMNFTQNLLMVNYLKIRQK